ncbi:hypothetical protein B7C51_10280 [Paenibacillus larvae subsp. pulvifaciens]|uniref:Uncharacterized protein n=1 Tax=Paenibacillus larvae subsp. pulvifaciens TaxID=1477 RepID=A0A1V0UST2_9BACL|nr:hypothetical protein B7C51_10280 [Paenibacillus larvae subsp. pulvifaciens]
MSHASFIQVFRIGILLRPTQIKVRYLSFFEAYLGLFDNFGQHKKRSDPLNFPKNHMHHYAGILFTRSPGQFAFQAYGMNEMPEGPRRMFRTPSPRQLRCSSLLLPTCHCLSLRSFDKTDMQPGCRDEKDSDAILSSGAYVASYLYPTFLFLSKKTYIHHIHFGAVMQLQKTLSLKKN